MKYLLIYLFALSFTATSFSEVATINNMKIQKIRAVADYPSDKYDNTIEIAFTTPISWSKPLSCTGTQVVYVDAKYAHVVSAAYAAMMAGKLVSAFADDSSGVIDSFCTISWLDIHD